MVRTVYHFGLAALRHYLCKYVVIINQHFVTVTRTTFLECPVLDYRGGAVLPPNKTKDR